MHIKPLRKKKDFEAVFRHGKRFFLAHVALIMAPNDLGLVRAGVIVGVKISKRAVVRNRARRRAREALRTLFLEEDAPLRPLESGLDIILLPKQSSLAAPVISIKKEIRSCFSRYLPNPY